MKKPAKPAEGIYRRVSVRMYSDERFMRLSPLAPSGQALWTYLLTGPHTGPIPGVFVIGKAAMAESLGWDAKAFDEAFAEVIAQGLAEFDAKTRLWFIPNAIRHNMPANPNVVVSWREPWRLLPECPARDAIAERLHAFLTSVNGRNESLGNAFAEACGKPSGKPSLKPLGSGSPKQEAVNRKQEAGGRKTSSSSLAGPTAKSSPTVPCPYESIVDAYHEALPHQPRVKLRDGPTWSDRQKAMRAMWGWVLSSRKADGSARAETTEQALAWFGTYFARASENDFLMGRTPRRPEHANWRCDFDFLLSKKGMKQVIEKTEVAA